MSHTPYFKFNNQIFHCIIVLDYERKQTAIKQLLLRLMAVFIIFKSMLTRVVVIYYLFPNVEIYP